MPSTTFEFRSAGLADLIAGYNSLGKSQQQLEAFVQNATKAFQAQGQTQQQALASAKSLADTNGITAKSFQEINTQQKASAEASARASAAIAQQAAAVKAQQAASAQLTTTLKGNEGAIASLTTAFGGNAKSANDALQRYKELQQAGVSLKGTQQALASELGTTDKQFASLAKSAGASRESLLAVAGVAGGVAAGLGAIAVSGVKAFAEFDQAIRTFGVVTQSTGTPQLAALRQEVERLAKETTQTPQDIAKLSVELGKAGFNAEQTKQALAGVVQSSEATGEGLVRTGEVIGATLNQFGLQAGQSLKIADLLTTASNASAAGTNDLGEALSYVGAQAKASNQTVEDTITTLSLLANAGIKGSSAGTGLAEALRRIKIASASASTELDDLKSRGAKNAVAAFDRLNESVRDSNGQLLPFPQILGKVKEGLGGLEKQGDKELLLNALFGVQGGRAIQSLLNQTPAQIEQVTSAMQGYEGASAAASKTMTQGLAGGFKLLESSTQLAQQKIGEFISVGLLPLVQGAGAVVNGFLALPAPLQIAVVGVGGLAAAFAAAVAVIATYQALQIATIAAEALRTAATIAQTVATGSASGIMLLFNTQLSIGAIASSALAAGQAAASAAMGLFSGAAGAGAISAGGLAAALGAVLVPLVLIAATAAALAIQQLTEQIQKQNETIEQAGARTDATLKAGINAQQKLRNAIDAVNAAKEKGVALSEEDRKKAVAAFEQAKKTLPVLQQQLKENKAVPVAEAGVGGLGQDEANAQNNARLANIRAVENQIRVIGRMQADLEKESGISKDNANATDANSKARRKNAAEIKDAAEEEKKLREAAKTTATDQNKDTETNIKRGEDDGKRDREAAFNTQQNELKAAAEKKIADQKKADEAAIAALKKQGDAEIQANQKQFDTEQNASKRQFEQEQAAFKKQVEKEIQAEEKAFSKDQQREEREFKRSLSKETKDAEKGFDAEQKRIDRQVNLQTAKPEDRAKLAQQNAAEDRAAKLKETLEAPLRKKREEFEAAQAAKEEAFREAQQAKKVEFEETVLAPKRIALEEQINKAKEGFEEQLAARKVQFEEQTIAPAKAKLEEDLTKLKEASEAKLAELKKANEDAIAASKKTFDDNERAIARQEEDAKNARERAFRDEQRKLDEASAERIEQIKKNKAAETPPPTPAPAPQLPGRKSGGNVQKGSGVIVGEVEPEVFIPGANGTILNRQQAIDNIHLLERVGEVRYTPRVVVQPAAVSGLDLLLKETIALRKVIESRNPEINFPVTFESSDRGQADFDQFLAFQRSVLRGGV